MKIRLLLPAVTALFYLSAFCSASVKEFTSTELYQLVQTMQVNASSEPWLILFHVSYCLHCLRLQPIMVDVEKRLRYTGIRVGKLDCTRDQVSGHFFHLNGFPTIRFYFGKTEFSFHGARNEERIVRFAKRAYSPSVRQLATTASLLETLRELESEAFFFLGCRTPSCTHESDRNAMLNVAFSGSGGSSPNRRLADVNLLPLYFSVARRFQTQIEFFYGAMDVLPSYLLSSRKDRDWPAAVANSEQTLFVVKDGTFFVFGADTEIKEDELLPTFAEQVNASIFSFVNSERFTRFPIVTEFDLHEFHSVHKMLVAFVLRNTTASNRDVNADGNALQYSDSLNADTDSNVDLLKAKEADEIARLSDRFAQYGEAIAQDRAKFHAHFSMFRIIGEFEWVSSIVIERVTGPLLLVYDTHRDSYVYLSTAQIAQMSQLELTAYLESVRDGEVPFIGGTTGYAMKRNLFTLVTGLYDLIFGAPLLALILFGLPSFIVGLLVYACCFMSDKPKPKKPQANAVATQQAQSGATPNDTKRAVASAESSDSTVRRRAPDRVMALPRIGDSDELASRMRRPAEYEAAAQQLSGLMKTAKPSRLFGFGGCGSKASNTDEADSHLKSE